MSATLTSLEGAALVASLRARVQQLELRCQVLDMERAEAEQETALLRGVARLRCGHDATAFRRQTAAGSCCVECVAALAGSGGEGH